MLLLGHLLMVIPQNVAYLFQGSIRHFSNSHTIRAPSSHNSAETNKVKLYFLIPNYHSNPESMTPAQGQIDRNAQK